MRLLLAQNMRYLPSHGGANKSNRLMLEALADRGHDCHAVAPLAATEQHLTAAALVDHLDTAGVAVDDRTAQVLRFTAAGVQVHVVTSASRLPGYARALGERLAPDWTLVPSDDPGMLMLGVAQQATPGRAVYLAHTLQQLPFGPRAFYPSASGTALVRRCAGVVAVSRAARDYLSRWGGVASTVFHPPVYGRGPFPRLGRFDAGAVTMINPCAYKGLAIFLGLADALPEVAFLAVPTWGTSAADRAELARRPNITVTAAVDDIAEVLARTRVLVMPSLWDETFGYTAVEAMLHGVPVLAAAVGGLREALLGVPHLLPVWPISAYEPQEAGEPFPRPVVPHQDLAPWLSTLRHVLGDAAHHDDLARRGRRAAAAFVSGLDIADLEAYLSGLTHGGHDGPGASSTLSGLPPGRRRALARLLAQRGG